MSAPALAKYANLRIDHHGTDFKYSATLGTNKIDQPEELRVHRGDLIIFESEDEFVLRFTESPFDKPEKTVLHGIHTGSEWSISARVRDDAILGHRYHYTVIVGDNSTDDPEIIIER